MSAKSQYGGLGACPWENVWGPCPSGAWKMLFSVIFCIVNMTTSSTEAGCFVKFGSRASYTMKAKEVFQLKVVQHNEIRN